MNSGKHSYILLFSGGNNSTSSVLERRMETCQGLQMHLALLIQEGIFLDCHVEAAHQRVE
jgi:hypothetical protein